MKFFFIVLSVLIMVPQGFAADKLEKLEKLEGFDNLKPQNVLSVFRADFCIAKLNLVYQKWTNEVLQYYQSGSKNERTFLDDDKYKFLSEDTLAKSRIMMTEMKKIKSFERRIALLVRSDVGVWCSDFLPQGISEGLLLR